MNAPLLRSLRLPVTLLASLALAFGGPATAVASAIAHGRPPSRVLTPPACVEGPMDWRVPLPPCGLNVHLTPTKQSVPAPHVPSVRLPIAKPASATRPTYWLIQGGMATPAAAAAPAVSATYTPTNILDAYNFGSYASGSGETIAIVDAYGDPTLSSDLSTFDTDFSLAAPSLNTYQPDGAPTTTNSDWAIETALDVEWAHAEAPAATIDLIIVPTANNQQMLDGVAYAVNDLSGVAALSMSWGGTESNYTSAYGSCTYASTVYSSCLAAYDAAYAAADGKSILPLAATGDWGAYNTNATGSSPVVQFPASSPDVLAVGGTTLTMNAGGTSYVSETAWSCGNPCSSGGTGGGYSTLETEPSYQSSASISDSGGGRGTPDVAFDADPGTGVYVEENGALYDVGGTSFATPSWAAIEADTLAAGGPSMTWSHVYSVYSSSTLYPDDFHDVTSGNNAYYNAGTGWDPTTGIGTPDVTNLIHLTALQISTTTLPAGQVGTAYSQALQATGGVTPYTWTVASGSSLPSGLSLSSAGVLSGTPTTSGTFSFTVEDSDTSTPTAQAVTRALSLSIAASSGPLSITTASLPAATAGTAYSETVLATGGTTPYTWSLASGSLPTGLSLSPSSGSITGTADAAGTSSFSVQVTDSASPAHTATATLSITVDPGPVAAVALSPSSAAFTAGGGGTQTFAATAQDAYGNTLSGPSISWTASGGTLSTSTGSSAVYTQGNTAGTYSVTATATQGGTSKSGTATVTIEPGAMASVTVSPASAALVSGHTRSFSVSAADAYGNAITSGVSYTWTPGGGTVSPSAGTPVTYTAGATAGTYTVGATGTDAGTSRSASASVSIEAVLAITTSSLPGGTTGTPYSATLAASGGTSPYTWSVTSGSPPAGLTLAPSTGVLSGTPTATGSSTFTVGVTDGGTPAQSATRTYTVAVAAPLSITGASLPEGIQGSAYSATVAATGGTAPYTWSVVSGALPTGLSLNPSGGAISGTPSATGASTFSVHVADSGSPAETASQSYTLTVVSPLAITTASLAGGTRGTAYSATVAATGGTTPYTWSISSGTAPAGLTLNPSTGVLSGTPTGAGLSTFIIRVGDATSPAQTATRSYTVDIAAPLSITTPSLPDGVQGRSYSESVGVSGGTAPYTWSLSSGSLPAGLSIDTSTGAVTGTPTAAGSSTFTVQVTDSASPAATVSQSLTLAVVTPLGITTASLSAGITGSAYTATVAVSGGTSPYTWSVTSGSLPTGLSVNPATGAVSGTPTAAGSATFTVRVTDSTSPAQAATQSYTLDIGAPLAITTSALPDVGVNSAYSATVTATGGTTPYTWSVTSGAPPTGVSLDPATGVLSGTATAAGTFTFTLHASDAGSPAQTASRSFSVAVYAALGVTTTSLAPATAGSAYSVALGVTGGQSPYTWSVISGSLPPGFGLSTAGELGGTTAAAGTYTFTVQVQDHLGAIATQSLTLTVAAAPSSGPSVSSLTPTSGGAGTVVSVGGSDLTQVRAVDFGTAAGTDIQVAAGGGSLTVVAPAGSGTVTVKVVTLQTSLTAGTFTYV